MKARTAPPKGVKGPAKSKTPEKAAPPKVAAKARTAAKGKTPRRKPATQVAALCVNDSLDKVLLITSRDTGRWIIPKGWPMRKKSLPGTALEEAWEEAGVEGVVGKTELGRYSYDKLRDHGFAIPVEVRVYPVAVSRLKDRFPEVAERKRRWFNPEEAAGLVAEEGLQRLIATLPRLIKDGLVPRPGGGK